MNWNYIVLSIAFAFFVMCPRMAGMCAVISETSSVNPYIVAILGGVLAIPLITLMVFLTIRFGVGVAIAAAVLTDILAAVATGTFRLRYGIEIALIALFIWIGVVVAGKSSYFIEKIVRRFLLNRL